MSRERNLKKSQEASIAKEPPSAVRVYSRASKDFREPETEHMGSASAWILYSQSPALPGSWALTRADDKLAQDMADVLKTLRT